MTWTRPQITADRASGLLMIAAVVLAFGLANSPLRQFYNLVHHTPVAVHFGEFAIHRPLVTWINEGLLAFFFLRVGLELKREFLAGQLSTHPQRALPAAAALGGMAAPAAIFVALNFDNPPMLRGWAVPIATDIVLALGILSLFGSRVPAGLKVFLTAIAIFDDVGAVLIIAAFYGSQISILPLSLTIAGIAMLALLNRVGVARMAPYTIVGIFLWAAMLKSGIHATLAGILVGLAIPMRNVPASDTPPLERVHQNLKPWVTLAIVPLFAFFNAGIYLSGDGFEGLSSSAAIGIVLGLVVGKPIGILGATWLSVRVGVAQLPSGVSWPHVYGVSVFAGIGFTMSLFIASLAFPAHDIASPIKLAVLVASTISAILGAVLLAIGHKPLAMMGQAHK